MAPKGINVKMNTTLHCADKGRVAKCKESVTFASGCAKTQHRRMAVLFYNVCETVPVSYQTFACR